MAIKKLHIPGVMLFSIVATIMWRYPITTKFYYVFFLTIFVLLIYKTFESYKEKISRENTLLFISISLIFIYMFFVSILDSEFVIKRYLPAFLLSLYLILKLNKGGIDYVEKSYINFTYFMNVLSLINLYQVFFHKPLLLKYMDLLDVGFRYEFGSFSFRTMSVFNHPIISGLFFVLTFIFNYYILKNQYVKNFLQIIILINIFTSYSRSAWLALVLFILILSVKKIVESFKKDKLEKRTYQKTFVKISLTVISSFLVFKFFDQIYSVIVTRFGDSLSFNSSDGSNIYRTQAFELVISHMLNGSIKSLLLGYGAGKSSDFMLDNPILIQNFGTTDNQYTTWFYDFGLIGILICLVLILIILINFTLKKYNNWLLELTFISFIVLSFELVFFEAWPVVIMFASFISTVLLFKFEPIKRLEVEEQYNERN